MIDNSIHWLSILYWTAGLTVALLVTFVVVSPCMLSSKISRDEEARELRNALTHIDRAA